ncbi:hypothetical protein [Dactylosporangium sp. CA-139066]|uniref:hypothetical protein n=1 Tax=Dactylosporangium sp. CA-139066 TaxID=3239930 RepID=UPI003D9319EF
MMANAQPTPQPTAPTAPASPMPTQNGGGGGDHHEMLSGVLHGEGIVQTTKGPVRVALQRGEASKLTTTSLTVVSTDGYSRTWTLNNSVRVYDERHTLQPTSLKAGAQLTVAGTASATATTAPGNQFTAKWIVVKTPQASPQPS